MTEIAYSVDDGIARIVIDRPERLNALGPPQRIEVIRHLADAGRCHDVRVVVISAVGRAFCAGGDLTGTGEPTERVAGDIGATVRSAQALISAVLDCPKPVVCVLDGIAAGMGAQFVLSADFVIASTRARIAELFITRGIVPDAAAAYLLPRLVGLPLARQLLMLGGDLALTDALRLGVLYKLVEPDELDATVLELTQRLAAAPTVAIALTKRLLNSSLDEGRPAAFEREQLAVEVNAHTADSTEGLRSFRDKRRPVFQGR
jgi:2-(1,2-epoxy-1,2-dihydrophenyl)acetyl-CoA isomerase